MFVDSHAHIDGPEFDADREAAIQRARDAGVSFGIYHAIIKLNVHIGTRLETPADFPEIAQTLLYLLLGKTRRLIGRAGASGET